MRVPASFVWHAKDDVEIKESRHVQHAMGTLSSPHWSDKEHHQHICLDCPDISAVAEHSISLSHCITPRHQHPFH